MKFDSVIIGGGLAGLVCGIRLSKAGRRCAIISSGQSALHFSSGSFDLLGALPDGTPVTAPAESVAETIRQAPEHPYARIGAERFGALAAEAAALLAEAGVAVEGDAARNHYRLTPMGGLKPAWLTLAGYVRSEASDALPWRKVVLFNAEGFLDFYTQFLAEGFRRMGTECAVRTFNMPALETIRNNPSEMRSANIARIFDRQENLDELARILRREAGDAEAVLLPAVLGIDRRDAAAQLERQAGRPVAMVATLPPSVPGLQAQLQLRRYFQQSGGVYMLGDTAAFTASVGLTSPRLMAAPSWSAVSFMISCIVLPSYSTALGTRKVPPSVAGAFFSSSPRSMEGAVSSSRSTFFRGTMWLMGSAPLVSRPSSTSI